ncbi:cytochrome b N-terminal domain-containing protein [bacterium]|nr:cytochrome b N-terminal domain-containing protein [bacterium]
MKRIRIKPRRPSAYVSVRNSIGNIIETIDYFSLKFFGVGSNPMALTGGIVIAFLMVNAVTGLLMLLFYTPTPELALESVRALTVENTPGYLLRSAHRASAGLLILGLLIHMVRVWATLRYSGARRRTWTAGIVALLVLGLIGWAGYILPWDERAMVLLSWGREIAYGVDRWPVLGWFNLGSLISMPVFAVSNEAEQLQRIFTLHTGGAFALMFVLFWHLRRVTPPKIVLPMMGWFGLLILLLLVGASVPMEHEALRPFNPFGPPETIKVDILVTFPLIFYPALKGPLLAFLIFIVIAILLYLPGLEPKRPPTAVVREIACTGCRICYDDCPYGAIEMIPVPDASHRPGIIEIATVKASDCNSCGICVGSCEYTAIELPSLTTDEILDKIDHITGPLQERL